MGNVIDGDCGLVPAVGSFQLSPFHAAYRNSCSFELSTEETETETKEEAKKPLTMKRNVPFSNYKENAFSVSFFLFSFSSLFF